MAASALDDHYWVRNIRVPLYPSTTQVAARVATAAGALPPRVVPRLTAAAQAKKTAYAPSRGVAVLTLAVPGIAAAASLQASLAADANVAAVLPTYAAGTTSRVDIGQFVVQFAAPIDEAALAGYQAKYGFDVVESYADWLPGGYLCAVRAGNPATGVAVANAIHDHEQVVFCEPDFMGGWVPYGTAGKRVGRQQGGVIIPSYVPADPKFGYQWHLLNTGRDPLGQRTGTAGADIRATEAWDITKGSRTITVAILDTGIDVRHEEFTSSGKILAPYDALDRDADPSPVDLDPDFGEFHGTACSGIAVADQDNNVGISGVAPNCRLMPIRWLATGATNSTASAAIRWAYSHGADVLSNSWGPSQSDVFTPIPSVIKAAIDAAAAVGRGGLGSLVLFSSGNSYPASMDNYGLQSYDKVLTIGSSNWKDRHSYYSQGSSKLGVVAPGGDLQDSFPSIEGQILTADMTGANGYTTSNYTDGPPNPAAFFPFGGFQGTSAACPVAAGVAALVLSANPQLTKADVEGVLKSTAVKIDQNSVNANWRYDASGHSDVYGSGRLDAYAAVTKAISGTPFTVAISTINGPPQGGRLTDSSTAIPITYTQLGTSKTWDVYDGAPVQLRADPGTTITVGATDGGGGANQRWILVPGQTNTATVAKAPLSFTLNYVNQLRSHLSTQVLAGAAPLTDTNYVTATVQQAGRPASLRVASTVQQVWLDAGTAVTFGAQSSGTTSDQRWVAPGLQPVSVVPTVSTLDVTPTYYQQVRPSVTLSGTTRNNQVSVTTHNLFGAAAYTQPEQASGTYTDWADVGTTLAFSDRSLGSPLLVATSPRSFTVVPALNGTVTYDVLPEPGQSGLTVTPTQLPADGTSQAVLTLTIRDSAGQPVSGIPASRLSMEADKTDGVTLTAPTDPTDANGQARFTVVRNVDGPVVLTATLDGSALPNTATVTFLPVMTIPVPVPGLYLLTFPLTTPDSATQIANFGVEPKPTRLAGYNEDNQEYQAFDPATPSTFFDIQPGKGWFMKTTTPGSIKLYGTWNTSTNPMPSYTLDYPKSGFHLMGNPRPDSPLAFRMQDIRVQLNGVDKGDLRDKANWNYVDPFVWIFNGRTYELIMDPSLPGSAGTRSQLEVFEGAFWRTKQPKVKLVITPGSVARAASPPAATAGTYGFTIQAQAGDDASRVVVGAQTVALRAVRPPAPTGVSGLSLDVVAPDGSRAAADFQAGATAGETTWKLHVSGSGGRAVTLSWPSLLRGLPEGYQVHLAQPGSGRAVLLNTAGSMTVNGDGDLTLSVSPRGAGQLNVLAFQPVLGRGRSVDFDVQLNTTASVVVQVCGLTGKIVTQTPPVTATGNARISWDGTDGHGRPLPAGVYQVVLIARTDAGDTVRAVRTVRVQ